MKNSTKVEHFYLMTNSTKVEHFYLMTNSTKVEHHITVMFFNHHALFIFLLMKVE